MSAARICGCCGHPIGHHNHLVPHACKEDRCTCPAYERMTALANVRPTEGDNRG